MQDTIVWKTLYVCEDGNDGNDDKLTVTEYSFCRNYAGQIIGRKAPGQNLAARCDQPDPPWGCLFLSETEALESMMVSFYDAQDRLDQINDVFADEEINAGKVVEMVREMLEL